MTRVKATQSRQALPRNWTTFTEIAVTNLERGLGCCVYVATSHAAEHHAYYAELFFVAPLNTCSDRESYRKFPTLLKLAHRVNLLSPSIRYLGLMATMRASVVYKPTVARLRASSVHRHDSGMQCLAFYNFADNLQ